MRKQAVTLRFYEFLDSLAAVLENELVSVNASNSKGMPSSRTRNILCVVHIYFLAHEPAGVRLRINLESITSTFNVKETSLLLA